MRKGLAILLLTFSPACEIPTTIKVGEQLPPTFYMRGNGNFVFFGVSEVVKPEDGVGSDTRSVWRIRPLKRMDVTAVSPVIYGKVPDGFAQVIPWRGQPPPALAEGKIYTAGGPTIGARNEDVWFTVKDGKVMQVTIPGPVAKN